jgi:predicted AAA+ superfamily ATPase
MSPRLQADDLEHEERDAAGPPPEVLVAVGRTLRNRGCVRIRSHWLGVLARAFEARPLVWLAGVRRACKTTLARQLPKVRYFDCELLRVRRSLEEPELFWRDQQADGVIVLDEVHRLPNPSEGLKVAVDHFPKLRVLATGTSTLAARDKFRDTLAGRKREVWLPP